MVATPRRSVWVLHHYADPPDGHWTGTYDVYKYLAEWGHHVTVFSSSFSHYSRREARLAPGETFREQTYDGLRFVFVRTTPYDTNNWRRVANMLTYSVRSGAFARRLPSRPDVVIGATPHPFAAYMAAWLARRAGAPFVLELHDLWLQYLLDTGALRPGHPVARVLDRLDRWCYHRAAKVMALWPRMDDYLEQMGVPRDRVDWVPIGIPLSDDDALPPARTPGDECRVVWTGRVGPGGNVQEILDAARLVKQAGRANIRFILIGGGPDDQELKAFAQREGLTNVEFTGMMPKSEIPARLRDADICVAGLPDVPTYRHYGTIPSKLLDYFGQGKPVVFISGIPDNALERAGAGLTVRPGDAVALAAAIEQITAMSPDARRALGERGRRYVREFHDPRSLAKKIETLIEKVIV